MDRLAKIRSELLSRKVVGIIASGIMGVGRVLPDGKFQRLTAKIETSTINNSSPNNTQTIPSYQGHDLRGG